MNQYEGYLLLHNISKPKNMGTIIRYLTIVNKRNSAAFNFKKVFLIGKDNGSKKKFKVAEGFNFFGNHGTQEQTQFQVFPSLKEAKQYFIDNNLIVCGVEIGPESQSVVTQPFRGNTVFFLGNEGTGLIPEHKAICDHFVYIPQYSEKTASLNVGVASGIIFHHFALWAGYKEVEITGEKFQDQEQMEKDKQIKKELMIQHYAELNQMKAQGKKEEQLEQNELKQFE